MNTLLFIVSDFPPLAGTNTQRVQNFVRYLPHSGWNSVVVTRLVEDMDLYDSRELGYCPDGCRIVRIANPDIFAKNRRNKAVLPMDVSSKESTKNKLKGSDRFKAGTVKKEKSFSQLLRSVASWILKWVYKKILYIPDALMPWANIAYKESLVLINKEDIPIICTSIPSYSCHIAGLKLKKAKPDIVWVADFRDLWVDRPGRPKMSLLRQFIESKMEKNVVVLSDTIIVASPAWKDRLEEKYGETISAKTVVITNGFDSEKLDSLNAKKENTGKIIITNTGAMFSSETPVPFLQALGELCQSKMVNVNEIEVRLIGYAGDEVNNINRMIDKYNLGNTVKQLGTMSHDECVVEQKSADILLLCNGMQHRETIRGKSFEYMATGKRILALTPIIGAQADILHQSNVATIVNHDDIDNIKNSLLKLIESVKKGDDLDPDWDYISSFSRKKLTQKFSEVLSSLVEKQEVSVK